MSTIKLNTDCIYFGHLASNFRSLQENKARLEANQSARTIGSHIMKGYNISTPRIRTRYAERQVIVRHRATINRFSMYSLVTDVTTSPRAQEPTKDWHLVSHFGEVSLREFAQ